MNRSIQEILKVGTPRRGVRTLFNSRPAQRGENGREAPREGKLNRPPFNAGKIFPIIAFIAILLAITPAHSQPTSTNTPSDCLFFRNGDLLYGKLLAIDPHDTLRWKHPDSANPIDFKPGSVSQIEFAPQKSSATQTNSTCRVYFGDGETLEGDLVSCGSDSVTLDTPYAGRLKISRKSSQNPILSLSFLPRQPAIFEGPSSLDGWVQGNAVKAFTSDSGQWIYKHGAFYANKPASIARDVKLPDRSEVQFDLAWNGVLNLAIALYTDSLQPILLTGKDQGPDFGAFYSLRFQNTVVVSLMPIRKKDPLHSLGDLIVPALNNKDRVHVDIRMSKPDHRIVLYFDGALVKEWIDPQGFSGDGTGMRFVQNAGGSIKLSNLRVTTWDGVMLDGSEATPDSTHDTISMEAGAKVSGTVQSIANGQITFVESNATTQIPADKVSSIDFAAIATDASKVVPAANTVRATFLRGGFLTFDLLSWRPDALVVNSPIFGKATFTPSAFSRLQFTTPAPKPPDDPKS
ncbi:MAG TPA: hypothetical protein VGN61_15670 [Verrucomicrobiae bacterium]|jgi:hypothetical protein